MSEKKFRIGIVQDNSDYIERAKLFLEGMADLTVAADLTAGLSLIRDLASGQLKVDLLALDERLDSDDIEGEGGKMLYDLFLELGLEGKIPVVSISSDGHLPIRQISSRAGALLDELKR